MFYNCSSLVTIPDICNWNNFKDIKNNISLYFDTSINIYFSNVLSENNYLSLELNNKSNSNISSSLSNDNINKDDNNNYIDINCFDRAENINDEFNYYDNFYD